MHYPPTEQDTLAGYAAVFSMMARVRRAEQLLRGARAPLAVQPRSTADLLLRRAGLGALGSCLGICRRMPAHSARTGRPQSAAACIVILLQPSVP